jgi:hypothetical protein
MEHVSRCATRDELERVLGRPVYALPGEGNSRTVNPDGSIEVPDVIECYELCGCCIDIQFTGGKKSGVIGVPKLTAWRLALESAEKKAVG